MGFEGLKASAEEGIGRGEGFRVPSFAVKFAFEGYRQRFGPLCSPCLIAFCPACLAKTGCMKVRDGRAV